MKAGGAIRLPAQVVVPPAQVEVIAAPLPALVGAVRVAYGETVKKGQPLARLQGAQLLELQRDFASAQAQAASPPRTCAATRAFTPTASSPRAGFRPPARPSGRPPCCWPNGARRCAWPVWPSPARGAPTLSGNAEIRAPFDGVVLEATAQPGSRVDAMTPLFKLGRLAPLWLEIQASPAQAAGIAPRRRRQHSRLRPGRPGDRWSRRTCRPPASRC